MYLKYTHINIKNKIVVLILKKLNLVQSKFIVGSKRNQSVTEISHNFVTKTEQLKTDECIVSIYVFFYLFDFIYYRTYRLRMNDL